MKEESGITLIALVITIIILLILSGITIAALTGDNGLIGKTVDAKNAAEEANIREELEVNVLASYKKRSINYDLLNSKLSNINGLKYKNNLISDTNKITNLPDWVDVKGYKFDILEDGTVQIRPDFEKLRSMYGMILNGYDAGKDLDATKKVDSWKLFYVDEENSDVFFISSNTIYPSELQENGIPLTKSNGESYLGMEDIKSFEYSKKYDQLWINSYSNSYDTSGNRKAIAYLCDPNNWSEYKNGKAKYAAGGPTMEMFTASLQDKQIKDLNIQISRSSCGTGINSSIRNGLYNNSGRNFWMASSDYGDIRTIYFFNGGNSANSEKYWWTSPGLRPIVCFPASAIKIDGENLSV